MQDANAATLRALFEGTSDAIIMTDSKAVITEANPATAEMFGYEEDALIGLKVTRLIPRPMAANRDSKIAEYLDSWLSTQVRNALRTEGRHKDGTLFPISLAVSRLELDGRELYVGIARDLTQILLTEELLRSRRQILDAIFEASPDAVKVIDNGLETTESNPASAEMLGLSEGEDRRINLLKTVHPEDRDAVAVALRSLISSQTTGAISLRFRASHSDGRWVPIEARAKTLRDEGHNAVGAVLVERDISQALEARAALEAAKDEAERANREKSEFLSRISHELRTPLNSILGFAQLLRMDELDPDQRESVNHIYRAGKHLLDLINEVLDISRIEAGTISVSLEPVSLEELAQECISLVMPEARERGIEIITPKELDLYVRADKQRMKQILLNLLSNAVKFNSDNGSVTFYCQERDQSLRIAVTDTGPGINPALRQRLFTPFDRLGAESRGVEGTGLGLALSQKLAEVMGGSLGFESTVGKGSTFYVDMPRLVSPQQKTEPSIPYEQLKSESASGTILYIEDNLANLALIEHFLRRRPEIRLITALQGSIGLELAAQHQPDLIMLDVHLPDMNGFDVLQRLRTAQQSAHIPVAILSADATKTQMNHFLSAGAIEYLTKPLELDRLLSLIDRCLSTS